MAKYMFHTTYTGKGRVGLLKEGGSRRPAVSLNIANAGALDIRATVLIKPETVDETVRKKVPYRPPGARSARDRKQGLAAPA